MNTERILWKKKTKTKEFIEFQYLLENYSAVIFNSSSDSEIYFLFLNIKYIIRMKQIPSY